MIDPNILGAQTLVTTSEFLHMPDQQIMKRVEESLAYKLASELVKSDQFELTQEPDYIHDAKKYKAEIVVLSREEYNRLKNNSDAAQDTLKRLSKEVSIKNYIKSY
jgi:hypothetical protein